MKAGAIAFLAAVAGVVSARGDELAQRIFVEPQAGTVWRTLDGPLLSGSGILPGSQVRFRGGSGHMEPYGGIFVGFRVNEFLSFRAGYEDFGATELKVQPPASASMVVPTDFRFRDSAFTFEPVLTWQLAPRVRVRGYWGVAFNRTDRLVQNYQVISPLPVIVVIGGPVSPLPYYDPHVPDRRTLSHLARQGASLAVKLTDRLDLDLGVDHQGLSSFADDAWMIHAGAVYSFDEAKWLENRLYVSTEAGEIWRKLDGPLHSQPGILPGGAVAYRNGSSDRALYSAVGVGVKLSEWLAIEGGYQDLGTTYVMLSEPPGFATFPEYYPPTAFRSRDYAYTLDAVFGWRAGQRVSLYGSAGAAFNYSDVVCETQDFYYAWSAYFGDVRVGYRANSSRSVQARFGAGATINLLSHLDLKLGVRYQKLASFASSAWMTHAGIALNF